jgi:hypothetical protein
MSEPQDILTEARVAEAANAAAVAQEAASNAHEAQIHGALIKALREVLVDGENEERPMLIKRIPFICNDIRDIKSDMRWIKWLAMSLAGGIGLLALKFLGA